MYTDTLTRIRNAQAAKITSLKVPFSTMDFAILDVLARRGFIESVEKKGRLPKRILEVKPRYIDGLGAIRGLRFVSTPSRHISVGYRSLRRTLQGYGVNVVSTSKGIMPSEEAKKAKLGGILLFEVW